MSTLFLFLTFLCIYLGDPWWSVCFLAWYLTKKKEEES
jgi:hypothetical protein